jgi:DNA (cytosine-5)-methyltransferase 1
MIEQELIVDSFAGGGGASTGIEMALGRSPDFAINHDAEALALHAANHPETVHLSKNIYKVDPMDVVGRKPVGLLWASPDCKHFSKAKGGAPVKRDIRDLAWTVVLWAKRAKPRVIILENVEEFQGWGPLVENAKGELMPCPDRRGETFKEWVGSLKKLGYKVEWKELRACDFGAPTTRKRLFVIARRDGRKIVWPEPTHAAPGRDARLLPWRTAASDVIDWSIPCPSIFDTSEEIMELYGVRAVRPLAQATLARIAKGVKRYVIDAAKPFIIRTDHASATTAGVHDPDTPVRTVTGAGGLALVAPHITKFRNGAVGSDIGDPMPTVTANGFIKRPGGAAPLGVVAAVLSQAQQGGANHPADEPHRTITASDKDQNQVVAAHLMTMRNAGKPFNDADKPTHTVTAGGAGLSLVAATMVQTGYGEREGQEPRALDIEKPLGTVVAGAAKHAVIAANIVGLAHGDSGGRREYDVEEPLKTIHAGGNNQALVAAFLAQHNTDVVGHAAEEPVSTIVQKGSTQAVVSAGLMNMKGSDRASWPVDGSTPTQTAGGQHVAEVRAFLLKYYGNESEGHDPVKPLGAVTTHDRFGIVTVEGEPYVITDIGMRMLTPRELFKAQGFPADYVIETGVFEDGTRRALTKTAQVRMCGNSVCPPIAAALVSANCNDLAVANREGMNID